MRHCHCHSNLLMAPPRESETCHFQSPMTIFSTPSSLALTPSSSSPHLGSPYIISKLCSLSNSTSFRATDFARVSSFNFLAYYSLTDVPEQLISRYLSHALALRFHRTPTSDCGTRTLVSGAAYIRLWSAACFMLHRGCVSRQATKEPARCTSSSSSSTSAHLVSLFYICGHVESRVWGSGVGLSGVPRIKHVFSLGEGQFQCECSFRYVLQSFPSFGHGWMAWLREVLFRGYDRTSLVCVGLESSTSFLDVVIFFC